MYIKPTVLLDASAVCAENKRRADEAARPTPQRMPTPEELDVWPDVLRLEAPARRITRERLARWLDSHGLFSEWFIKGQWLDGAEAARRLRLGDDLTTYLHAENGGRSVPKDRRR